MLRLGGRRASGERCGRRCAGRGRRPRRGGGGPRPRRGACARPPGGGARPRRACAPRRPRARGGRAPRARCGGGPPPPGGGGPPPRGASNPEGAEAGVALRVAQGAQNHAGRGALRPRRGGRGRGCGRSGGRRRGGRLGARRKPRPAGARRARLPRRRRAGPWRATLHRLHDDRLGAAMREALAHGVLLHRALQAQRLGRHVQRLVARGLGVGIAHSAHGPAGSRSSVGPASGRPESGRVGSSVGAKPAPAREKALASRARDEGRMYHMRPTQRQIQFVAGKLVDDGKG